MEKTLILHALGTSNDWLLLKHYCKSNNIPIQPSLYFFDDWQSLQKSHLNISNPSITVLIYHNHHQYTSLSEFDPSITTSHLQKSAPKSFISKQAHKKYIEWEISFSTSSHKILLELNFLACPRTCENFWQISTSNSKLSYLNSKIHRSVPTCYIEGGIIDSEAKSIYLDYFPDENFNFKHDVSGVIGMVKSECGKNGTQFYITLRPIEYFDGKLVAFGRVVEGMEVIREIAMLPTSNQRIVQDVFISKTNEYLATSRSQQDDKKVGFRDLANELLKFV